MLKFDTINNGAGLNIDQTKSALVSAANITNISFDSISVIGSSLLISPAILLDGVNSSTISTSTF
jgi:hypothetical protein